MEAPAELKHIVGKYLARASQMDTLASRKPETGAGRVAFYCRQKALTDALAQKDSLDLTNPAIRGFITDLMSNAETAKTSLGITVESGPADREIVKKFALNLFSAAENDLKQGSASEMTARRYLNAATLLEVMELISPLDQQLSDIHKYAKYMVGEVATAVREGRAPVPPAGPNAGGGGDSTSPAAAAAPAPAPAPPAAGMPPPPSSFAAGMPSAPGSSSSSSSAASSGMSNTGAGMPAAPMYGAATGPYGGAAAANPPPGYLAGAAAAGPPPAASAYPGAGLPMAGGYPPAPHGASSMYNPAAMAAAAAQNIAPTAQPSSSSSSASASVDLTEYVPVSGACWSKEVILSTRECSLAVTLLRSDDIYGAKQHLQKALKHLSDKIEAHERSGGAAKRL